MSTYQPTSVTDSLYNANRRLMGAKVRIAQGQLMEASALHNIKQLESGPGFQGTEDREYVANRIKIRNQVSGVTISDCKKQIRRLKKLTKEIK